MSRRTWNGTEIAILEGYPVAGSRRLAEQLGRSEDAVSSMARRLGLRADGGSRQDQRSRVESSPSVNAHFFGEVTGKVAYVLGVIWGCGRLRLKPRKVLILDCPEERQIILNTVRNLIGSRHKVQRRPGRTRLEVCNSFLVHSLINNVGHRPVPEGLTSLPKDILPFLDHFARGLLDATGDEAENGITLTARKEVIGEVQQQIRARTGLPSPHVEVRVGGVSISWRQPEQIHILKSWLPPAPVPPGINADPLLAE